jgi:energy-converting hydrogenase Eha subunit H
MGNLPEIAQFLSLNNIAIATAVGILFAVSGENRLTSFLRYGLICFVAAPFLNTAMDLGIF